MPRASIPGLATLGLAGLCGAGCVERVLQVKTDPPLAAIYVNGDEVGSTGADGILRHRFTFYGTVDVTARAPGHISSRELVTLTPPWYQMFPADFIAEVLLPWTITDLHPLEVKLAPSPARMDEPLRKELRDEAEELRSRLPAPAPEPPPREAGS